jgi:hypothetical protein
LTSSDAVFFLGAVFEKLLSTMGHEVLKDAIVQKRLKCPACDGIYAGPSGGLAAMLACPACGYHASGDEWMAHSYSTAKIGRAGCPPPGTKIQYSESGSMRSWAIPPLEKCRFLLTFATLWLGLMGFITISLAMDDVVKAPPDRLWQIIFTLLCTAPFWALGLGMLYYAHRRRNIRSTVTMDEEKLTLTNFCYSKSEQESIPLAEIRVIHQTVVGEAGGALIYGIEVKSDAKRLRFGELLTADEKAWLVAEFKRAGSSCAGVESEK